MFLVPAEIQTSLQDHFYIFEISRGRFVSDGFTTKDAAEVWIANCPFHRRENLMVLPTVGPARNRRPAGFQFLTIA